MCFTDLPMENFIVGAVLGLIIGAAVFYLVRAKRRGEKCIGCPYAKMCGGKCDRKEKDDTSEP